MTEIKLDVSAQINVVPYVVSQSEELDDDLWISVEINDSPAAQMRLSHALDDLAKMETDFCDKIEDVTATANRLRAIAARAIELADRMDQFVAKEGNND